MTLTLSLSLSLSQFPEDFSPVFLAKMVKLFGWMQNCTVLSEEVFSGSRWVAGQEGSGIIRRRTVPKTVGNQAKCEL
jgi:hypothetical protein